MAPLEYDSIGEGTRDLPAGTRHNCGLEDSPLFKERTYENLDFHRHWKGTPVAPWEGVFTPNKLALLLTTPRDETPTTSSDTHLVSEVSCHSLLCEEEDKEEEGEEEEKYPHSALSSNFETFTCLSEMKLARDLKQVRNSFVHFQVFNIFSKCISMGTSMRLAKSVGNIYVYIR